MTTSAALQTDCVHDDLFWCASSPPKTPDLKAPLESRVRQQKTVSNYSLHHMDLSHINLVNHGEKHGFAMKNCDFYRSKLMHAHLFNIDLSGSSLMKADLSHANLHRANLEYCNLLGVILSGARLENIHWGEKLYQEYCAEDARKKGDTSTMIDNIEQAEEIYRSLRLETEKQGLFEVSGNFFRKEMIMRRLQLPLFSLKRFMSVIVDWFCGYGEKPINVVSFSLVFIFLSAMIYFCIGINQGSESLRLSFQANFLTNLYNFFSCLYFSVVTFTTLGYGELTPMGLTRAMAAMEAFVGSFTMALFVVVFVKKMTR
jgi:Ion channel/Pentapeptide repeats (8 copies)